MEKLLLIGEVIDAIYNLGMPVAVISWFVVRRLYARGELQPDGSQKDVEKQIEGIEAVDVDFRKPDELLRNKWLQLGGGFYGAAGLWTLFVLELVDLSNLLTDFPGWSFLLKDGVWALLLSVLQEQIQNFVAAVTWFLYWAGNGPAIPIWIGVAYVGYALGVWFAKYAATQGTPD